MAMGKGAAQRTLVISGRERETGEIVLRPSRQMKELRQAVEDMRENARLRPHKWTMQVFDLADPGYRLRTPLLALVEEYEDDKIAVSLPGFSLYADGSSVLEALGQLKIEVLDLYDELSETDPEVLGPLPASWLVALDGLIERV